LLLRLRLLLRLLLKLLLRLLLKLLPQLRHLAFVLPALFRHQLLHLEHELLHRRWCCAAHGFVGVDCAAEIHRKKIFTSDDSGALTLCPFAETGDAR
jgi:hypothetical protein